MPLRTRVATAADYGAFARLFPELRVPDPLPSEEQFARRMLPRVLLLAGDDGETIGYAFWQRYGRMAHVVQVVVDPRTRGRGGGAALMEAVRVEVVRAGCSR